MSPRKQEKINAKFSKKKTCERTNVNCNQKNPKKKQVTMSRYSNGIFFTVDLDTNTVEKYILTQLLKNICSS